MKIEVTPNGIVKIDTDAPQALAGVFPIHVTENDDGTYVGADHTAVEISDALEASMLPIVFLRTPLGIVVCHLQSTTSHSDELHYEFWGWSSWAGKYCLAIGPDGKAYRPK